MICTHVPYLKAWRKSRGYSSQFLAHQAKISRQTIWALEAGVKTARTETIIRLAHELDVTPHDLVSINPIPVMSEQEQLIAYVFIQIQHAAESYKPEGKQFKMVVSDLLAFLVAKIDESESTP